MDTVNVAQAEKIRIRNNMMRIRFDSQFKIVKFDVSNVLKVCPGCDPKQPLMATVGGKLWCVKCLSTHTDAKYKIEIAMILEQADTSWKITLGHYFFLFLFGFNDMEIQTKLAMNGLDGLHQVLYGFINTSRTFDITLKAQNQVTIHKMYSMAIEEEEDHLLSQIGMDIDQEVSQEEKNETKDGTQTSSTDEQKSDTGMMNEQEKTSTDSNGNADFVVCKTDPAPGEKSMPLVKSNNKVSVSGDGEVKVQL